MSFIARGLPIVQRICAALVTIAAAAHVNEAGANEILIRDATVHTVSAAGRLAHTDVRLREGRIVEIGPALKAGVDAVSIDAQGRPLTPGLFGGITALGVEEVSLEPSTVDHALAPGVQTPPLSPRPRPEFDLMTAFNAKSVLIPVSRVEGISFAAVAPSSIEGGSFVAGQGALVTLDGRWDAELPGSRALYVHIGEAGATAPGASRAAQWMLLEQLVSEAAANAVWVEGDERQLSAAGRTALRSFLRAGRVAFRVDRAADLLQVLRFARRAGIRPIIVGGAQAWMIASELAAAKVPVVLDPFLNLPGNFDQLGARLDNAARLHAAGVQIAFTLGEMGTHNARKLRQGAGIAVAYGLPWDAALAAITAAPAEIFGVAAERGRIAVGQVADLVLWSGDPLEVTSVAEQVWIAGVAQSMRSRQSELRDRYLSRAQVGKDPSVSARPN